MKYPVFLQDRDKWVYIIESESGLSFLEAIDIENKEYIGWNVTGVPIDLYLDKGEIIIRTLSEMPQLEKLKKAILDYASIVNPKIPFSYYGNENDITDLFRAAERHRKTNK